jgi:hypothetical protein
MLTGLQSLLQVLAPATDALIVDTLAALGPGLLQQCQSSRLASLLRRLVSAALGRGSGAPALASRT